MREIKFRVWDEAAKRYSPVAHMMNVHTGVISDATERYVLEQYTGFKDKNGREIYEGDILAHDDDYKHSGVVQFCKGLFGINWNYNENTDPEWKEGQLYGSWGDEHNLRKMGDGLNREMVVIGNIHENPELLQ